MNLSHLKTFVAVAELRHFARAASACNLSQPAVSHQIAQLEENVGARLLNRAARRVSLTVAGDVMLEEARRILATVDRARERMQHVTSGAVGRIRLGATATPGLYVLPPIVAAYRDAHPAYELQFQIGSIDVIAERVARNELDMAVVAGGLPKGELRAGRLFGDELVAVARRRVPPAAFESQCWIMREETSTTRRVVDGWMAKRHLTPARVMTFDGPDAVKHAVEAGLGIAIVSALTIREELKARRLVRVDVGPLPAHDIYLIDHPQKHHGAACTAMLQLLRTQFRGS